MWRRWLSGSAALCWLLGPATGNALDCTPTHLDESAFVEQVIDGDTLRLTDGRDIRVIGVDAPETAHRGYAAQPYGNEAREAVMVWLGTSRKIGLRFDVQPRDRFGRQLAHVTLPDGRSLAQRLLERGLVSALVIPPNLAYSECYVALEAQAQAARKGIWTVPRYQTAKVSTITTRARGYHALTGKITAVRREYGARLIVLEDRLHVRVAEEHLRYFPVTLDERLVGRRATARGRLYTEGSALYVEARHPSVLAISR